MGEALRDPRGTIIQWYGLTINIDERKRAEDHLRDTRIKLAKASRLATVAELAGSIAHLLVWSTVSYSSRDRVDSFSSTLRRRRNMALSFGSLAVTSIAPPLGRSLK
jgi:hypothetical protein